MIGNVHYNYNYKGLCSTYDISNIDDIMNIVNNSSNRK